MAAPEKLSDRAKHRLKIAAGLLRADGLTFDCPRDQFYTEIQRAIANLTLEQQARLKDLTDWVEAYELADDQATRPRL